MRKKTPHSSQTSGRAGRLGSSVRFRKSLTWPCMGPAVLSWLPRAMLSPLGRQDLLLSAQQGRLLGSEHSVLKPCPTTCGKCLFCKLPVFPSSSPAQVPCPAMPRSSRTLAMTLSVHLCASQCKQRRMLAAIQSAHTLPKNTTDKGSMSQSWDCPHGEPEPGVQTLTALWEISHKFVVAFVGQEKVIHSLYVWGLLEVGLASHLLYYMAKAGLEPNSPASTRSRSGPAGRAIPALTLTSEILSPILTTAKKTFSQSRGSRWLFKKSIIILFVYVSTHGPQSEPGSQTTGWSQLR